MVNYIKEGSTTISLYDLDNQIVEGSTLNITVKLGPVTPNVTIVEDENGPYTYTFSTWDNTTNQILGDLRLNRGEQKTTLEGVEGGMYIALQITHDLSREVLGPNDVSLTSSDITIANTTYRDENLFILGPVNCEFNISITINFTPPPVNTNYGEFNYDHYELKPLLTSREYELTLYFDGVLNEDFSAYVKDYYQANSKLITNNKVIYTFADYLKTINIHYLS